MKGNFKSGIGAFVNAYVHHTLEDAMAGISRAGFRRVELLSTPGLAAGMLKDPVEIGKETVVKYLKICSKYGLLISGLYFYKGGSEHFNREKVVDKFEKLIDVAEQFNTRFIITDTDEVKNRDDEKSFYKYINTISDLAGSKGVKVCLDIHGEWCSSGKKASEIVKNTGNSNIGINYCTGNVIYYANVRPEEDIKHALPYIERIHLKDSCGIYKGYDFPPLGKGTVDFKNIFKAAEGFNGPMSVEVELSPGVNPLVEIDSAFKTSYDYLSDMGIS